MLHYQLVAKIGWSNLWQHRNNPNKWIVISNWPNEGEKKIKFDKTSEALEYFYGGK
ncbi:hypothetical protein SELR_pSRC400180 (plasmid) [Selenomonas ruminantium subsp. lactilytica TAM6421]|uniref:Uncharacterized protein n=1 Tax=Selenomonas ruminantium subsp. lactilytica (strain NBRC 103574 / TAM6421) TaxID=927704 RepID=I0GV82_SELRL|nr:hypothetical protein [Selenomonas ruminantium]BAL84669.1 hypothetical protein SELR_pSRC400180 [Selenomonas ruminantium subsp. lactilytica TAM6421]